MKKLTKFFSIVFCVVIALSVCSITSFAQNETGKISVLLEDSQSNDVNDLKVGLIKVADLTESGYVKAKGFENSQISIDIIVKKPTQANAKSIYDFALENKLSAAFETSKDGRAEFSSLKKGIYLIFCEKNEGFYFNPHFAFIPFNVEGEDSLQVVSRPKINVDIENDKSIYVIKKWDDNKDKAKKRPKSITVYLKSGDKVIDKATLKGDTAWAHTFEGLSEDKEYYVREKKVEGYEVKYSGDSENGFIITNTYNDEKLPQTGQMWWPIMVLALCGALFILLGIIELGAKKNEKKKQ